MKKLIKLLVFITPFILSSSYVCGMDQDSNSDTEESSRFVPISPRITPQESPIMIMAGQEGIPLSPSIAELCKKLSKIINDSGLTNNPNDLDNPDLDPELEIIKLVTKIYNERKRSNRRSPLSPSLIHQVHFNNNK